MQDDRHSPTTGTLVATLAALLIGCGGCSSFQTTIMHRLPGGHLQRNAPTSHTRGVPVTLKVPSHVEVVIEEDFFIQKTEGLAAAEGRRPVEYREVGFRTADGRDLRTLSLTTRTIYTEKVFTVDFKRPAGGLLDVSKLSFDEAQYFESIAAKYEERTLEDINTAIGNVRKALGSSQVRLPEGSTLYQDKREVARARFDISAAGWECQLVEFVERHITGCQADCFTPH